MPPLIIAHRGLPKSNPENTLPSFRAALEHKPDVVECDYRHSADGVPMVIHDDKLDRTTDAVAVFGRREIVIGGLKRDELRRLDAGKWFDAKFAGTVLPTLEETIDAVCPTAKLMIERKGGDPATLVPALRAFADAGVGHVQLVLDPITVESIVALQPTVGALGG